MVNKNTSRIFGLNLSNMNFNVTLGEALRSLREEKKLTLKEAANLLCIDWSMLARIEKGQRSVSVVLFSKLSDLYEVKEKDLRILALADKVYKEINSCDYANLTIEIVLRKLREDLKK